MSGDHRFLLTQRLDGEAVCEGATETGVLGRAGVDEVVGLARGVVEYPRLGYLAAWLV